MSVFETLNNINVNSHTEKKNGLTYLSWAWAWAEVKKHYPEAFYTIYENAGGLFYHTDGRTAWVKTGVTIEGIEHIEYLPVMDYRNRAIPLDNLTSFDVNKAIQRSLTKAVARHGLGLYIYAGEDLPESEAEAKPKEQPKPKEQAPARNATQQGQPMYPTDRQRADFQKRCAMHNVDAVDILKKVGWTETDGRMTSEHWAKAMFELNKLEEEKNKSA